MGHYRIRTLAGGGFSLGVGPSVTTFEIEDVVLKQRRFYTLSGVDFGFGLKAGAQGPSSWTYFVSSSSLTDFHGYVTLLFISGAVGVGAGGFRLSFVTGPSGGLTVPGVGWGTGINASAGATHGWMKLRN